MSGKDSLKYKAADHRRGSYLHSGSPSLLIKAFLCVPPSSSFDDSYTDVQFLKTPVHKGKTSLGLYFKVLCSQAASINTSSSNLELPVGIHPMHVSSGLLDRHTLESPEKGTLTDGPPLDFLWANQRDVFLVNGGS